MMRPYLLAPFVLVASAITAAAQTTVQIDAEDCSQLVRHVAADDVTYRAGVDLNGDAVAPADLDGTAPIAMPGIIVFPLTLDLASRLGIPPGGNADYLARPIIGAVAIDSEGAVTFNGVPLTSEAQHELALLCQRQGGKP